MGEFSDGDEERMIIKMSALHNKNNASKKYNSNLFFRLITYLSPIKFIAYYKLSKGDRIKLYAGYFIAPSPAWLCGKEYYLGTIISFIPGQFQYLDAVVELDKYISLHASDGWIRDMIGNIAILELRYRNAKWKRTEIVSIELCDFIPENKPFDLRQHGLKIESHANYQKIKGISETI